MVWKKKNDCCPYTMSIDETKWTSFAVQLLINPKLLVRSVQVIASGSPQKEMPFLVKTVDSFQDNDSRHTRVTVTLSWFENGEKQKIDLKRLFSYRLFNMKLDRYLTESLFLPILLINEDPFQFRLRSVSISILG